MLADVTHQTPLTDALRRWAADEATGRIAIDHPGGSASVWLDRGWLVSASAPGARARLGDRLVAARLLTDEELGAALQRQRNHPAALRLGEVLLELGLVDQATRREVLLEQTLDSLAVAIGWADSTWTMVPDEACDEDVALDARVENALMEASRRLDEWQVLGRSLGSLDARVDVVPSRAANLELTADEWTMLTHIDGHRSVAELAADTGVSAFQAARIVYGLLATGVVQLLDDSGPAHGGDEAMLDRRALSRLFAQLANGDADE